MSCAWPGCEQEYTTSVGILRNRKRERLSYYCIEHAAYFRDECFATSFQSPYSLNECGYISFDLFLVIHSGEGSVLWFREISGERGIGFMTGPAEGYSLQARLGVDTPGILSSHSAWLDSVQKLGGNVNRIIVKDFAYAPRYLVLKCAMLLEQMGQVHEIPIKASDAFALAIESKAPIMIEQEILQRLPSFSIQRGGGLYLPGARSDRK